MRNAPSAITRAISDLPATLGAQARGEAACAAPIATTEQPSDQSGPPPGRWDIMTDQLDLGREPAANEPAADADEAATLVQERALVRNVVAQRFVLARELNGLSQTAGAHAIGYAKSGQLSLIESGRKAPPLDVLLKASEAYSVSIDFLLGVSDHEERDPRLARRAAMRSFVGGSIRGLADVLADVGERLIEAPAVDAEPLATAAGRVVQSFARVAARPDFQEIRGGATVAREVRELEAALQPVLRDLHRFAALDAEMRQRIAQARLRTTE